MMDEVYADRNRAVMLAAYLAVLKGLSVGVRYDDDAAHYFVLSIELPTGQVAWHIPEDERIGVWKEGREWDGHTNDEKAARIREFITGWRTS